MPLEISAGDAASSETATKNGPWGTKRPVSTCDGDSLKLPCRPDQSMPGKSRKQQTVEISGFPDVPPRGTHAAMSLLYCLLLSLFAGCTSF